MSGRFDDLKFFGRWRPHQRAALAAFEKDPAARHLSTHIVAPPGSGKTLLGVELIRRVGKRALVLAPHQGIQQQWPRAVGEFTPHPAQIAGADPLKPIARLNLISRPLADPRRGPLALLGRVLTRRPPFGERLHPVPKDLARNKERAEAFARAWSRYVGPGRQVFTQRSEAGRRARAEAASGRRRLRDLDPRRVLMLQGILGRVLAVLGGAVGGVRHVTGRHPPLRERDRRLLGGVTPGVLHRAPLGSAA